ncbi:hypothetical protein [Solimonas terrae]|uniref:Uncharacterized protein n=1 Tax=Solimonas terrae TaxID=1396819 RepID=A0A6M2BZ53_9GAMM|nr:hypothetical protein [Solimonas terrae]NGY07027.1 hypothetical protein [Solimonas terrae]
MRNDFQLESDGGKTKYIVLGAVALVFAAGAYALIGKDSPPPKAHIAAAPAPAPAPVPAAAPGADTSAPAPVAAQDTMPEADAPASVASDETAAPATAGAQRPVEDDSLALAQTRAPTADEPYSDTQADTLDDLASPTDQVNAHEERNRTAVRPPPPPAVDTLSAWWRSSSSDAFSVQYVGQAATQPTLVVRLSQGVAHPDQLSQHIELISENGTPVSGRWQSGANGFVLLHDGLAPGRYTLKIDAKLASASGKTLPRSLSGPVYIE